MFYSSAADPRSLLNTVLALTIAALLGACTSLPTDFDRNPSYAVTDTGDTRLGRRLQPVLEANPGKSGFYTLREGEAAFAITLSSINHQQIQTTLS